MPASVVEPVPGWNRLQIRKEPDPESPSSISRKEPNSYSGADSGPESLTALELRILELGGARGGPDNNFTLSVFSYAISWSVKD